MHERFPARGPSRVFTQRLLGAGIGLILLFTVLAPETSQPLTFFPRLCFWSLHIGLGLFTAELAARLLIQRFPALNDWRLVLISGLIGVTLFAPMAYLLEGLFPLAVSEPDSDWSDRFASTSPFAAVLVELLEMAPSYLVAWLLINREALVRTSRSTPGAPSPAPSDDVVSEARRAFLNRLPPAVGRQVVAISSDLHYLQVTTRQGSAMILGALKEVETAFGEAGMRVHRSHWVLLDAVQRMRKGGSAWQLEMSNGHCVPVNRRKRTEVLDRLGEDFVRHSQETKNV